MKDGRLDTTLCRAFRVPAGVLVEVYGTSLHYAPCHTDPAKGFRVLIALPKGTNDGKAEPSGRSAEDRMLFATNKWLIAHPDAPEASAIRQKRRGCRTRCVRHPRLCERNCYDRTSNRRRSSGVVILMLP